MREKQSQSRKEEELRDRVRRHKIHWQAWPEYHVEGAERRQVGFRLGLLGTNDHPSTRPVAVCPESWKVYTSLRELARWVLPEEEGEGDLQVSVDDAFLVRGGDQRDIMVTIKIGHRRESDRAVDAREMRYLADIEERLIQLGAPQG